MHLVGHSYGGKWAMFAAALWDRAEVEVARAGRRAERDVSRPLLSLRELVKAEALRAKQEVLLTDYRLIDRQKGVVAIPIERAMETVVREGGRGHARP